MAILNNSNAMSVVGGYDINNSVRLRRSATASLNRTNGTSTNQSRGTWSFWFKRGQLGVAQRVFEGKTANTDAGIMAIEFFADDTFVIGGWNANWRVTTQVFRDPSAWYHIVVAVDTTQATANNRILVYVNGTQITAFGTTNNPTQNSTFGLNNNSAALLIGVDSFSLGRSTDGYLADINFIDGQQLTPSSFGETDNTTGVWKPKAYSGSYGTNGYYLKFSDIATTSGSNAGLGRDFSSNTNYFNTNNISVTAGVTYDAMTDVPTNTSATTANYAVMNPLELGDGAPAALSNGNLTITGSSSLFLRRGTMNFPLTGKYYCEFTVTAVGSGVSIAYDSRGQSGATQFIQYDNGGTKNINGTTTSYGASFTTGDVVAMAVDADGGSIAFYKNNTSQGSITFSSASMTGVNATAMVFAFTSAIVNANFGQRPFAYTPPTGFNRLNTFNLPTSTIVKGNTVMDATLYTGNGTTNGQTQNITGLAFDPDLIWVKSRSSGVEWHGLNDTVRGAGNVLASNATNAEFTGGISSITNGFQVTFYSGGNVVSQNTNNNTYVGWTWDAGSSTVTNTSGSISSQVRANTTAGFSVVSWTGNGGASATVGHGLGVAPKMVIARARNANDNWWVYHQNLTSAAYYLILNSTAAQSNATYNTWNSTAPSSSVITLGSAINGSFNMVAYCWAEIAGFSRFGSYTGNGSADGPFIYTGFRPEWIMIKSSTEVTDWHIMDASRLGYNANNSVFYPNNANAEQGYLPLDILSNGFKLRATSAGGNINASGQTYIYAAFAQNPFKNSLAR